MARNELTSTQIRKRENMSVPTLISSVYNQFIDTHSSNIRGELNINVGPTLAEHNARHRI